MPLSLFQPKSYQRKRDFAIGAVLGTGGNGQVKIATEVATGKCFAVKIKQKRLVASLASQIRTHKLLLTLDHPRLIKMHEWFESRDRYYLIFDIATGGELFQRLIEKERFTESEAREVALQLIHGLDYLHGRSICHRDIKLENVLYRDDGHRDCCLSDFGLAVALDHPDKRLATQCGSGGYTAPKVYSDEGYGTSADMWSLGVVLFCLLGGRFPYRASEPLALAAEAREEALYFPRSWESVTSEAHKFVSRLLTIDQLQRMTAKEALAHPWLGTALPDTTPTSPNVPSAGPAIQRRATTRSEHVVDTNADARLIEKRPTLVELEIPIDKLTMAA